MKETLFSRASTFIIILSPLFLQYTFFFDFILLPELFISAIVAISLLKKPGANLYLFKWLFLYLALVIILTLFSAILYDHFNFVLASTTYSRFLFYSIALILISSKYFIIDFGAKLLVLIAVLNAVYGLIQYFSYSLLGVILPWHLPFLSVHYGKELITEQAYYFNTFGFRFSGLFSEPAHFSQYLSFALFFVVFYKSKLFNYPPQWRFSVTLVIICALLMSGSGTGFFAVAFIAAAWVFKRLVKAGKNPIPYLILIVLIPAISYSLISSQSESFLHGFSRITSDSEFSTLYIRIIRPFEVYLSMDLASQIFGIGYGNYAEYLEYGNNLNDYERARNVVWTNSAVFILAGGGMISLAAYLLFHVDLYSKSTTFNKGIIFFVMMHLIYSDLPLSIFYVAMMSFVVASLHMQSIKNYLPR